MHNTKTCIACKIEKPLVAFHRNRRRNHPEGRDYRCRDCISAGTRKPVVAPEPLRPEDLGYCAAMVDGEGSIMLLSDRWLQVRIFNNHRPMLEWVRDRLGGTICSGGQPQSPKHCQSYFWVASMRPAIPILRMLLPLLQIKRRHAEVAIAFAARLADVKAGQRDAGLRRVAVEDDLLTVLAAELKVLNRRGPPQ